MRRYNESGPVNLGSGMEISIKDLVHLIGRLTGFEGEIMWDTSKPDGQPRRQLDVSPVEREFGFKTRVLTEVQRGIQAEWPDWVLVQRDMTTTMAVSLVAFYRRVKK